MQILMNFLSNALKFTNKNGSVSIAIKIKDRQNIGREIDGFEWV